MDGGGSGGLWKDLEFLITHYEQLMMYLPICCPLAPTLDSHWVEGGQVLASLIDFQAGWAIRHCRGLISCLCTQWDSPSLWGKGAWLLPLASTSIVPHWHPVLCFLPTTTKLNLHIRLLSCAAFITSGHSHGNVSCVKWSDSVLEPSAMAILH